MWLIEKGTSAADRSVLPCLALPLDRFFGQPGHAEGSASTTKSEIRGGHPYEIRMFPSLCVVRAHMPGFVMRANTLRLEILARFGHV